MLFVSEVLIPRDYCCFLDLPCVLNTLLENLTGDSVAELYVTKLLTISLYFTKLYVTKGFAIYGVISQMQRNPPKLF